MLLEINHRDPIPPDKYKVGESSLGGNYEGRQGSEGGGVGGDVGEGGGEGAGGLTFSDNPTVENIFLLRPETSIQRISRLNFSKYLSKYFLQNIQENFHLCLDLQPLRDTVKPTSFPPSF